MTQNETKIMSHALVGPIFLLTLQQRKYATIGRQYVT